MNDAANDPAHQRPDGLDDETVAAVGKLTEALEWIERARGRLYDFHQLIGHADAMLDEAVELLEEAGHPDMADRVREEAIGRNVIEGRWTFQIVEDFDANYYSCIRGVEEAARNELCGGRKHLFESELKDKRRTPGRRGHERRPVPGG
ncbi:MAG TPA: hypothetical protein VM345_18230 [Acidimicrobiales bacterium]|nr:hypothetical protein [Acidimicrobiales bacterium]